MALYNILLVIPGKANTCSVVTTVIVDWPFPTQCSPYMRQWMWKDIVYYKQRWELLLTWPSQGWSSSVFSHKMSFQVAGFINSYEGIDMTGQDSGSWISKSSCSAFIDPSLRFQRNVCTRAVPSTCTLFTTMKFQYCSLVSWVGPWAEFLSLRLEGGWELETKAPKGSPSPFHPRLSNDKEREVKEKHTKRQGEHKGFSLRVVLCERDWGWEWKDYIFFHFP